MPDERQTDSIQSARHVHFVPPQLNNQATYLEIAQMMAVKAQTLEAERQRKAQYQSGALEFLGRFRSVRHKCGFSSRGVYLCSERVQRNWLEDSDPQPDKQLRAGIGGCCHPRASNLLAFSRGLAIFGAFAIKK